MERPAWRGGPSVLPRRRSYGRSEQPGAAARRAHRAAGTHARCWGRGPQVGRGRGCGPQLLLLSGWPQTQAQQRYILLLSPRLRDRRRRGRGRRAAEAAEHAAQVPSVPHLGGLTPVPLTGECGSAARGGSVREGSALGTDGSWAFADRPRSVRELARAGQTWGQCGS